MDSNWFQFIVAIILVTVAVSFVAWFLRYKASRSKQRMYSMLEAVGVDSEVIRDGDHEAIFKAVTKRCNKCQAEDVCERWLAGNYTEDNLFCPNAHVFRALAAEQKQVAPAND